MAIRFDDMEQRGQICLCLRAAALLGLLLGAAAPAAAKSPVAVATIRPIAALAAGVMGSVGMPATLIPADQVPQTWTLGTADENLLRQADIVLWIGPALESPLSGPFADLEIGARIIALADTPGLLSYPPRQGAEWEPSADAAKASDDPGDDGHFWLDPDNVKLIIGRIANALTDVDFVNVETYRQNAADLRKRMDALDRELALTLRGLGDRPFLVLHDDLQYLETRYDLTSAGSLALGSDPPPRMRVAEVIAKAQRLHVVCVLGDAASDDAALHAIAAASKLRTARIDLYGADAGEGTDAYFKMMRTLAATLKQCLGGNEAE
jgi:zinc transport system substrate-binding protein